MKVHLIGSMRHFDEDIPAIKKIANIVDSMGHFVLLNWFESVSDRRRRDSIKEQSLNWPEIVESNVEATLQADVLIVEGSRFNYSQGYQTAIALQHNKPVLNLYRNDLPEYKEWPDKLFVSGISHPLFSSKAYATEQELEKIVAQFLDDYSKKTHELSINLSLDDVAYKRLQSLADENQKSESGIAKDLLSKALSK